VLEKGRERADSSWVKEFALPGTRQVENFTHAL